MTTATTDRAVSTSRGTMRADVSRQWASRPDDQKFLSLDDLYGHVHARRENAASDVLELHKLQIGFDEDLDEIGLEVDDHLFPFTNWSFEQGCRTLGAPANYLRKLPLNLAAANLQAMALLSPEDSEVQRYTVGSPNRTGSDPRVQAVTGPKYGRIYDAEVVGAIHEMVRTSGVEWKVPGVMNWGSGRYDPSVPVSLNTTTLFSSDRDVFVFLCDDLDPIEVGKLPNGDPDLMFRGFIVSNSEVGARKLYIATMYLRAVCANRCLWGVENFREIQIRHNAFAPDRFRETVQPTLATYTKQDGKVLVEGVRAAKRTLVADQRKEEEQVKFLTSRLDFSEAEAKRIIGAATECEKHPPESIWDFAQGLTAYAQTFPYQDKRFAYEVAAGQLLDRVNVNTA